MLAIEFTLRFVFSIESMPIEDARGSSIYPKCPIRLRNTTVLNDVLVKEGPGSDHLITSLHDWVLGEEANKPHQPSLGLKTTPYCYLLPGTATTTS